MVNELTRLTSGTPGGAPLLIRRSPSPLYFNPHLLHSCRLQLLHFMGLAPRFAVFVVGGGVNCLPAAYARIAWAEAGSMVLFFTYGPFMTTRVL